MSQISVNGELETLPETMALTDLLHRHNPDNRPVAVAVNGDFVPRSQYENTSVQAGDQIDIVSPVGGG